MSPEMKLASYLAYLKRELRLSVRQLSIMCGYGEATIRGILDTGNMDNKQYERIWENLSINMDDLYSKFLETGRKDLSS